MARPTARFASLTGGSFGGALPASRPSGVRKSKSGELIGPLSMM